MLFFKIFKLFAASLFFPFILVFLGLSYFHKKIKKRSNQKLYFDVYIPAQKYFHLQKNFPCLIHYEHLWKNVDVYVLFIEENFNTEDSELIKGHINNFKTCLSEICANHEYSTHGFHQSDRYILDHPETVTNQARIVLNYLEKFTVAKFPSK